MLNIIISNHFESCCSKSINCLKQNYTLVNIFKFWRISAAVLVDLLPATNAWLRALTVVPKSLRPDTDGVKSCVQHLYSDIQVMYLFRSMNIYLKFDYLWIRLMTLITRITRKIDQIWFDIIHFIYSLVIIATFHSCPALKI